MSQLKNIKTPDCPVCGPTKVELLYDKSDYEKLLRVGARVSCQCPGVSVLLQPEKGKILCYGFNPDEMEKKRVLAEKAACDAVEGYFSDHSWNDVIDACRVPMEKNDDPSPKEKK